MGGFYTYWHVDCVHCKSFSAFTDHYQNWCKRKVYNFSAEKAKKIYNASCDLIAVFLKDESTKMLIRQAVEMLDTASATVESLRQKMTEIGDVTRFTHWGALTAFAGVDPGKDDSGQHIQKSVRTTKKVLRIYYGRVREYLSTLPESEEV